MRTKLSLTISTLAALCLAIDAYSAPWSVRTARTSKHTSGLPKRSTAQSDAT